VRDDSRAGFQLEQPRQELGVEIGQQVHRDHARARQVGVEDVAGFEARPVGDTRPPCIPGRRLHQPRVIVDAESARSALGRLDDDAAVARAQVDDVIAALHLGHAQHALDDLHRRIDVRHGAVVPAPGLRLRVQREQADEEHNSHPSQQNQRNTQAVKLREAPR